MRHFNFLAETVVSDLKAGASIGRAQQVRVWSAACSTGEEAYSIAITLVDALRDLPGGWQIEVVASDTDSEALATAGEGVYDEKALDGLPPETRKRHFLRGMGETAGRVRVNHSLSERVRFQSVDLNGEDWAVEGSFNVIFFRLGLLSLHRDRQEPCLRAMLRYLNPHGYLILDPSDRLPWLKDVVSPVGQRYLSVKAARQSKIHRR